MMTIATGEKSSANVLRCCFKMKTRYSLKKVFFSVTLITLCFFLYIFQLQFRNVKNSEQLLIEDHAVMSHFNLHGKRVSSVSVSNTKLIISNGSSAIKTDSFKSKFSVESSTVKHQQMSKVPGAKLLTKTRNTNKFFINDQTDLKSLFKNKVFMTKIDCQKVAHYDINEVNKGIKFQNAKQYIGLPDSYFRNLTQNCNNFKQKMGYITSHMTEEELYFPLAYSILMYKDIEQVERLLRAIYRPQNFYCIHVDQKSKSSILKTMKAIAKCFTHVHILSPSINVRWGEFSVLEPELLCMKQLLRYKWKYFINLTGQEFPLKTNYQLVRILKAYNGANDVEGTQKRANTNRWEKSGPPPHGIKPIKGSVHVVVQRGFVDYALNSPVAKDLLEWTKTVQIPDELYFATLNHNPHLKVPGSYTGIPETGPDKPFLARYKIWENTDIPFPYNCKGKTSRSICVFGLGDLQMLTTTPALFANKFFLPYHPLLQKCLEDWHFNKTRDYYLYNKKFNTSFYENLSFVKNKI
ncbi:beta-1,3-galactosyl-O-glycosyl-glycoprotein beta-1,6-N-acetylglucosaminyltransferase isoform X2 [Octopus sinensis]|uniref:Beta-1,3-galactosyl-O-glycosyl-glycoprotein beta-1,6-N-acetylglucosaminyltransferase isoform X2 n=1 Tax=Octopus sinensis TaxID=2607531 RepID=A0A6P7SGT3_9MOLL|nr:beta-1,3-galactosyl-O-glycosyl-glycoprotein beta-1,6-N-acetylglucosaminyltransferase isoform X2 [Octopus sinensis]